MVGQVLMKGRYSYYRCRSRYVGRSSSSCPSKYIPTNSIEGAVVERLMDVLGDPERIMGEADDSRLASIQRPASGGS